MSMSSASSAASPSGDHQRMPNRMSPSTSTTSPNVTWTFRGLEPSNVAGEVRARSLALLGGWSAVDPCSLNMPRTIPLRLIIDPYAVDRPYLFVSLSGSYPPANPACLASIARGPGPMRPFDHYLPMPSP